MTKKSIVCTVTNDLTNDRRMYRICSALHEAGYDVTLVGREKESSLTIPQYNFKTERLRVRAESGPLFYVSFNLALAKYLIQNDPDIIYAVDTDTLLGCSRAVNALSCKFVYDAHEYFTEVPELEGASLKKWIWQLIENKYIPKTDCRITVGEQLSKLFEKKTDLKYHVVRNVPLYRKAITDVKSAKDKILLYQGVLNKGRCIENYIDSLKFLDDDNLELHLVGRGDLEEELKRYAKSKAYSDRIHFHGWKMGEELDVFTNKAWIGLNLLEANSLNYKFSLANKFFDYMHAGVPSLNSNLPEYSAIINKYEVGLLLHSTDPQQIAKSINDLSAEQYRLMENQAELASKIYNWQRDSKILLDVIMAL